MKIKTLQASNPEDIDKLVNDFEEQEGVVVKATQTHVNNDKGVYTYVLFYIEESPKQVLAHKIVKG